MFLSKKVVNETFPYKTLVRFLYEKKYQTTKKILITETMNTHLCTDNLYYLNKKQKIFLDRELVKLPVLQCTT